MSPKKQFYITTPIYYANDVPHIGHTGTTVFADITARYHKLIGDNVFFLTGTDEHGEKVALAAKNAGKDPQEFVDELADKWKDFWQKLNIDNDAFMRTTFSGHVNVAQDLLVKLKDKGDIYKSVYKGVYCVGCEEFKSEKDLVDGKCPEHRPDQIEYKEEENYFFKITKYIPTIKKYIEDGTLLVEPENKKNEMLSKLDDEIHDLSISRQNVSWGIPIPWDTNQTTYVWVEALMNYYSATIFDWTNSDSRPEDIKWPADVHFLGKGNNWFHTVIWPSMLLALGLELPRRVFVHGYYNVDGKKMGKSLGNVISPQDLMDRYGIDATRYLLAASMPYADDSDVNMKWFDERYNSDLVNGFGNLVRRVGSIAKDMPKSNLNISSIDLFNKYNDVKVAYEDFKLHHVVELVQKLIKDINEELSIKTPWQLDETPKWEIMNPIVDRVLEISMLLSPIIGDSNQKVKEQMIIEGKVQPPEILFPRL